ncbi:MAG: hypothetical protein JSR46_12455 [Verrucomicrobia bacterium]|nr:hypothetical protein [Verrucomicrobiota bacterium]
MFYSATSVGQTDGQNTLVAYPQTCISEAYLDTVLACILKASNSCFRQPPVLYKITIAMRRFNPTRASELFQQTLTSAIDSGSSDWDAKKFAKMIHLTSQYSEEDALQMMKSLKNDSFGKCTLTSYLKCYGQKNSAMTEQCVQLFEGWKLTDRDWASFAAACRGWDFEYALKVLEKIEDLSVSVGELVKAGELHREQISDELIDSYLPRIEKNDWQHRSYELMLTKLKLNILRGIEAEEVEEWIFTFSKGMQSGSQKEEGLRILAQYCVKRGNMQRALDVCLMNKYPLDIFERIITSITPELLDVVSRFIDKLERKQDQAKAWLSIASQLAVQYPEIVRERLPALIAKVEECPNGKELYWKPGMGKRSDAYVSYVNENIGLMHTVIEIYLKVDAVEEAEGLKDHKLLQIDGAVSCLRHKLAMADYYVKKNPEVAEKCYSEAIDIMKKVNSYDWDHDRIREAIAKALVHLNPERALPLVLQMRERTDRNRLLLEFVKVTRESNGKFADSCLEKMSEGEYEAAYKARALLKRWEKV